MMKNDQLMHIYKLASWKKDLPDIFQNKETHRLHVDRAFQKELFKIFRWNLSTVKLNCDIY